MNDREDNLLRRAQTNYNVAVLIRRNMTGDEAELNMAAYHLQQSVELAIKHILESNGIEYPWTHDIEQLIKHANDNGVDAHVTDYIDAHAEMFSLWEAKTRYVIDYLVEARKVDAAIPEVQKYLDRIHNLEISCEEIIKEASPEEIFSFDDEVER